MNRKEAIALIRGALEAQKEFYERDRKLVEKRKLVRKDLEIAGKRYNDLVRQDQDISHESATDRYAMLDAIAAAFPAMLAVLEIEDEE